MAISIIFVLSVTLSMGSAHAASFTATPSDTISLSILAKTPQQVSSPVVLGDKASSGKSARSVLSLSESTSMPQKQVSSPVVLGDKASSDKSVKDIVPVSDLASALKTMIVSLLDSITVIDQIATSLILAPLFHGGGGSSGDTTPPSFGGSTFSSSEYPFSIDGIGYHLYNYSNTIPTVILETEKKVDVKLLLYDNSGPQNIEHIGLFTNLRDLEREKYQSDTYITFENNKTLQIIDPHHFFSEVKASTTVQRDKLQVDFVIKFANPMERSDIILDVWDFKRNDVQTKILYAWQIVTNTSVNPPKTLASPEVGIIQNGPVENPVNGVKEDKLLSDIKMWAGYSSQSISDSELLKSMGINASHIPSWVIKVPRWIVSGDVTLQEFTNSISYLYEKGIISQK